MTVAQFAADGNARRAIGGLLRTKWWKKGRQLFDRNKILNGLLRACNKRRVTRQQLDDIVLKVERNIRNTLAQEVPSVKIGEIILTELRNIDAVAYIRFASVYRQFGDLDSFMEELKSLMGNEKN